MLPTETFDPCLEEISRFAGLLVRTRRSVRGSRSRRTDAVRLRLVSLPGGRMLELLEGPGRAESVLRLGGFTEVELRPPETMDLAALADVGVGSSPDEGEDRADPEDGRRGWLDVGEVEASDVGPAGWE